MCFSAKAPATPAAPPVPSVDDPEAQAARKRLRAQMQEGGLYSSTVLTTPLGDPGAGKQGAARQATLLGQSSAA